MNRSRPASRSASAIALALAETRSRPPRRGGPLRAGPAVRRSTTTSSSAAAARSSRRGQLVEVDAATPSATSRTKPSARRFSTTAAWVTPGRRREREGDLDPVPRPAARIVVGGGLGGVAAHRGAADPAELLPTRAQSSRR